MKMVKDNEVKFVDFRFTDTRGKEHHVTVPVSALRRRQVRASGHAFDGSSIAGWKGIEASDMLLMPDPNTANIDPFFEEPTLLLTCDVIEPADGKGYERDPRSLAKRAEAYLKASGLGDTAFFGPEPEFFVFDSSAGATTCRAASSRSNRKRPPGTPVRSTSTATTATVPRVKGGYFPVPPVDSGHDMRSEMCLPRGLGIPGRSAPPRSGQRRPDGDRHQVQHADRARRLDCNCRST
jgi:glutamine synthetase